MKEFKNNFQDINLVKKHISFCDKKAFEEDKPELCTDFYKQKSFSLAFAIEYPPEFVPKPK